MDLLEKKSQRAWPTYLFAGVVALALLAAVGYGLMKLFSKSDAPKKQVVHQISLLKPPPPPPPPKPQEKPQEIKKEEVKLDQPKPDAPKQDNAPEGKQLGVDAEGGAGSDGFGLVGNRGGRDLLGGGGRMAFAFYTNQLQRYLQGELAKNKHLRGADYRVVVRLWLGRDGAIQRVEIAGSSGNTEVDAQVRTALGAMAAVREMPPENMPQPVKLRISNRGAG